MLLRYCLLLTCLPLPGLAAAGVCVTNGTDAPSLFVAEAKGAAQVSAMLNPAQTLCSGAGPMPGGVVRVFATEDAIEGCSRLVAEGQTEILIEYQDFDRCHWSSHDG